MGTFRATDLVDPLSTLLSKPYKVGHSTVSITLDIYSHAIPALQESAAELVAALVLSAPPAGYP